MMRTYQWAGDVVLTCPGAQADGRRRDVVVWELTRLSRQLLTMGLLLVPFSASLHATDRSTPSIVRFRGIQAGSTSTNALLQHSQWGQPYRRATGHHELTHLEYSFRGYGRVVANVRHDRVLSIDVTLPRGVSTEQAAAFFRLGIPLDEQSLPPGALVGGSLDGMWQARPYSAGRVALFIDGSGTYPTVKLMRFYSEIDSQAQEAYDRGRLASDKDDKDAALAAFTEAVRLEPSYAAAYKERGDILVREGNLSDAREEYENALRIHPTYAQAHVHLGNVFHHEKKYEAALKQYETAAECDAGNADAHNSIAWLRATCPVTQLLDGEVALTHARKACELTDWKVFYCLDSLAAAYAQQGDFQQAQVWLNKAIQLAPETNQELLKKQLDAYRRSEKYHW